MKSAMKCRYFITAWVPLPRTLRTKICPEFAYRLHVTYPALIFTREGPPADNLSGIMINRIMVR